MESLTTAINVNVDAKIKKEAASILKGLGLNMSTAINMFLTQIVKRDGIPFEVTNPKPNKELLEAIKEGDQIIKELKNGKRKGYNNVYEMFKELDEDIANGRI